MSTSVESVLDGPIPVLTTVAAARAWREAAFDARKSVGFVPTMGALHDGHLSLVRRALADNDLAVLSIFVNPSQFAPHEDLATYPRTLPADLARLAAAFPARLPAAVFAPSVTEMYPSGIEQDVAQQTGAFVELSGLGHKMEGAARPTFFRGVATVVTKLFNVVQPTRAYFGQKDIQQALLLRRLCADLLFAHPLPAHVHIVPTARDAADGLALSSRNAHLSPAGRAAAGALYAGLRAGADAWADGAVRAEALAAARAVIDGAAARAGEALRVDYVELNDARTLDVLAARRTAADAGAVILSGALWVGTTRLIDNVILGDADTIIW